MVNLGDCLEAVREKQTGSWAMNPIPGRNRPNVGSQRRGGIKRSTVLIRNYRRDSSNVNTQEHHPLLVSQIEQPANSKHS